MKLIVRAKRDGERDEYKYNIVIPKPVFDEIRKPQKSVKVSRCKR